MAAWNVTICSSASSLLKMNSKNHVEQVLGMVPSPQVSPSTIRDGVGEQYSYGASVQQQSASKRGFYAAFAEQMGDEEMVVEEEIMGSSGGVVLKKRRLTMDQVRFLESNFESENKLEPERKVQIAQRLGLQPRQVAVWFQNRRARSKSKQLERDFLALKADYHAVLMENEKLQSEVDRLNAQLRGGGAAAEDDVAEGGDGNDDVQQQQFMLIKDSSTNYKTSGSSSTNFPNLQSDDGADKPPTKPAMKAEASMASVGNDLQIAEELPAQPCTILAGVNVNVNVSASVMPLPIPLSSGAAAVMAMVGDNAGFLEAALLPEDLQSLSNFMQQACAHQLLDLCTDSLHFDNGGLFLTAPEQDPWGDY